MPEDNGLSTQSKGVIEMRTCVIATAIFSFAFPLSSTLAHHSVAMFDQTQEIAIDGVVRELELVNPHSWLHITVTTETGREVDWSFEMQALSRLSDQGFSADLIKPGEPVTVFARPLKDGSRGGQFRAVRLADGREFRFAPRAAGRNQPGGSANSQ